MDTKLRRVPTVAVAALAVAAAVAATATLGFAAPAANPKAADLWAGKKVTDRSISLDVTVEASPAQVYELWTTSAGVRRFLAPGAEIEPHVGGRFQVTFDPANDPEGRTVGTYGCKFLRLEPNKLAAFEWTYPPLGPETNTQPFPTWVEVRLEAVPGHPQRTIVHFKHLGFPHGPKWDEELALFRDGNWPIVLSRLQAQFQPQAAPEAAADAPPAQP